jgi:signal transduction histidine kinase
LRELLGKHHFEQETFDLNQVGADLEAIIRAEAKRRGVRLEFKREPGALPVIGDRIQVQQVLLNLVLNAMDAVQDQSDDRREVSVAVTRSKRRAVLAVSDRGPGILPEHLPLVFDSFFSTKTEGMGLGLSISRTIVEAHGGRLWVDKTGGEGTSFRAELPLANHKTGLQSSPT